MKVDNHSNAAVPGLHPFGSRANQLRAGGRARQPDGYHNQQTISEAVEQIRKMPAVDMDKLARIKAMLRNGTYTVDAGKTAAGMLTESLLADLQAPPAIQ